MRFSTEAGGSFRTDGRDRKGAERRVVRDAKRCGRASQHRVARAEEPGPCGGTHGATAGSDSTACGRAVDEGSSGYPDDNQEDGSGAQVFGHGIVAVKDERGPGSIRYKTSISFDLGPKNLRIRKYPAGLLILPIGKHKK